MYHKLINEDNNYFDTNNDTSNALEFKNRSKEKKYNESSFDSNRYELIEHNIRPNETLQGIALRYNCSICQIRLINHIMSDQDFYMLSILRIPVLKHSLLTDTTNKNQITHFVNDLVDVSNNESTTISSKTQVINIGISKYFTENNKNKDYQQFLNKLSMDLEEIRKFNESKLDNDSMITDSFNENEYTTRMNPKVSFPYCDGSDFGIHWKYLIAFTVFICLLVPLYILYNLEHHNSTHGHSH